MIAEKSINNKKPPMPKVKINSISHLAKKRLPFNYREPPINPVTPMRIEANIMV